jgi:SAM-dependent methyltransferase
MEEYITDDGSITFYNKEYDEHYHSKTGAREEALEKHVKPAIEYLKSIGKLESISYIKVLDFCFGLGYNSYVFIEEIRKLLPEIKIKIVGLDNDIEIISKGREIFKEFLDKYVYSDDNIEVEVLLGDAQKELFKLSNNFQNNKSVEEEFDEVVSNYKVSEINFSNETLEEKKKRFTICFFDPFSPKKCPDLWTEEIFKNLFSVMDNKSILTTYSCARKPRQNMENSGFIVKDGPCIGRLAPSTNAIKE